MQADHFAKEQESFQKLFESSKLPKLRFTRGETDPKEMAREILSGIEANLGFPEKPNREE